MRLDLVQVADGVHQARTKYVAWVLIEDGGEVTLVDTGWCADRSRLLASLEGIGRSAADVTALILTHGHRDHQGSAKWFQSRYGVPVSVHEEERANATGTKIEEVPPLRVLRMAWRPGVLLWGLQVGLHGRLNTDYLTAVETFTDGSLDVPGRPVCVPTPGHTSGHVAFHLPSRGVVIAGDALMTQHPFGGRITRVQLVSSYFNKDTEQAVFSLERLRPLAADVVVPGHGPPWFGQPAAAVDEALSSWAPGRAPH